LEYQVHAPQGGGWLLAGRTRGMLQPCVSASSSDVEWEVRNGLCHRVGARASRAPALLPRDARRMAMRRASASQHTCTLRTHAWISAAGMLGRGHAGWLPRHVDGIYFPSSLFRVAFAPLPSNPCLPHLVPPATPRLADTLALRISTCHCLCVCIPSY
jgi:hypothetical protein